MKNMIIFTIIGGICGYLWEIKYGSKSECTGPYVDNIIQCSVFGCILGFAIDFESMK
jgi:hypothetical protein